MGAGLDHYNEDVERKQRYYDGYDPDNLSWKDRKTRRERIGGAVLLTVFALAAVIALAVLIVGCASAPLTPVVPLQPVLVRACVDAEVTVNGIPKRTPGPDYQAGFNVAPGPVTVVYKAPGDAVGITHTYPLSAAPHQILIGSCVPLTAPDLQVSFVLPFTPLPRVVVDGKFFSANGQPFFALGASSYALLDLYLHDRPAFDSVVTELRELGFNEVRVWTLADVNFSEPHGGHLHIVPSEIPDFYTQAASMAHALAGKGIYVEYTVFTGTARLMPTLAAQQAHLDAMAGVARAESNVSLEVGNEYEQGDNQWLAWMLTYPTDITISGGSVGSDNWPSEYGLPTLGYLEYHSNDAPQWWRKNGHEAMELGNAEKRPAKTNEMTKADDDGDEGHWFGAFQACKLLADGCTFHFRDGRMSRLMSDGIKALAKKAIAGANSIAARCRRIDDYQHRTELEGPNQSLFLRVYQQGTDPQCFAYVPN